MSVRLLPFTGKIPHRMISSTRICLNVLNNCLYFLTMSGVLTSSITASQYWVPYKHPRSPPHLLYHCLTVALVSDPFRCILSRSHLLACCPSPSCQSAYDLSIPSPGCLALLSSLLLTHSFLSHSLPSPSLPSPSLPSPPLPSPSLPSPSSPSPSLQQSPSLQFPPVPSPSVL